MHHQPPLSALQLQLSLLLLLLAAARFAGACESDIQCQLNGACTASACVCRPGWTGEDCGQLDFLDAPTTHAFFRDDSASWGGTILEEEGAWHMFLAYMEGNCGLNSWQPNSAIWRAVSSTGSPAGPYVNETRVLPWFSHNPSFSRHPDGSLLVWHIGNAQQQGSFVKGCANGTTPPPPPPPPVKFSASGGCLASSGAYPCWVGGGGPYKVCPLVLGDCSDASAGWGVEGTNFVSALYPSAMVNIDCNSNKTGTVAKLFGSGGSPLVFNKSTGQIRFTDFPDTCLSNGATGAVAPCGGGGEPWLPAQIHVVPCSSPDSLGWSQIGKTAAEAAAEGRAAARGSASPRAGASAAGAWPLPTTDVNALVSTSGVAGPFVDSGVFQGPRQSCFPFESDNPAPLVFPNGSTWVMYRSWNPSGGTACTTPIGIARSDAATWNTSYSHGAEAVPIGFPNAAAPDYVPLEDPYLFIDSAANFHALFHNMGGCSAVGCHAFSADGFAWYLATSNPYTSLVRFADGSSVDYARRERPHLVFNSRGDPAFLSNGVQESWSDDHSYTLVQQINVPWP